ncbi:MAG: PepSY-associated TM helix domain-containing protein, partial [Bacteroidales bacterium]
MIKFFKKYHKWLSLIFTLFILFFSVSGIVLNHREMLSGVDVSRNWLPDNYKYTHWNNAAVAGTCPVGYDSLLIYGNIGLWLTDRQGQKFVDFNNGFPEGTDNRKISKVVRLSDGTLFAGSYFGLYQFDTSSKSWYKVAIPSDENRITDLVSKGDSLLVLTRSHLLISAHHDGDFKVIQLPPPLGYNNKSNLFKTLWIIHSGEILGLPGILLVDFIGLIFLFLTMTGLIYWLVPYYTRRKKRATGSSSSRAIRWRRFSLKWHNKIGWTMLLLLIITTSTGMFLRPPLLAAIFNAQVGKIPYSILDTPNPWFDKLRRILYDPSEDQYFIATLDGIYRTGGGITEPLQYVNHQPPASVMGVNVFEFTQQHFLLVGSFEGLFLWNPVSGYVMDYIKKGPVQQKAAGGPPIGEF